MQYLTSNFFIKLSLLACLLIITGCRAISIHGQFVSDSTIKYINNRKLSYKELITMIGTPTYVPDYSLNTFYYIQRSVLRNVWLSTKVLEQRIVKITFDSDDFARAMLLKNTHDSSIIVNTAYTKSYGTEQSIIQKFVKNIGRFNHLTK